MTQQTQRTFARANLLDLLRTRRLCCRLATWKSPTCYAVTDLLRGNWCNGFWPTAHNTILTHLATAGG